MRRVRLLLVPAAVVAAVALLGCEQLAERTLSWSQRKMSEMMPWQIYALAPSPDGSKLALSARKGVPGAVGSQHALLVLDAKTGEVLSRDLDARECDQPLGWAPDGRLLTRRWHLPEADVGRQMEENPRVMQDRFRFSPAGELAPEPPVAPSDCWLVDLAGGKSVELRADRRGREGLACWTPDRKTMLLESYSAGWQGDPSEVPDVVVATGTNEKPLCPSAFLVGCAPAPRGGWLAVVRRVQGWQSDYAGLSPSGKSRSLLPWHQNVWAAALSPDGRYLGLLAGRATLRVHDILFSEYEREPGWLILAPLVGGEPRTVSLDGPASSLAWSPDGRRLALCGSYAGAWEYSLGTGKLTRLAQADLEPCVCAWVGGRIVVGTADGQVHVQPQPGAALLRPLAGNLFPEQQE